MKNDPPNPVSNVGTRRDIASATQNRKTSFPENRPWHLDESAGGNVVPATFWQ